MITESSASRRSLVLLTAGVLGCALIGLGAGTAVAQVPLLWAPAGLSAEDGRTTEVMVPEYPENSSGETYGSAAIAVSPETEPDLILVVATNGQTGYVKKVDLDSAQGPTEFKSPNEALEWHESMRGSEMTIPVYAQDGKTAVGQFVIYYPTAAEEAKALKD